MIVIGFFRWIAAADFRPMLASVSWEVAGPAIVEPHPLGVCFVELENYWIFVCPSLQHAEPHPPLEMNPAFSLVGI